jgi:excisionase family DNA binding protein
MSAEELRTVEEAARTVKISKSKLQHLIAAREIPFFRLGRRVYLHPHDLEVYVASRRVEPFKAVKG